MPSLEPHLDGMDANFVNPVWQGGGQTAGGIPQELVTADEEDGGVMRSHSSFTFDTPPPATNPPPTIEEVSSLAAGMGACRRVRVICRAAALELRVDRKGSREHRTSHARRHLRSPAMGLIAG